MMKKVFFLKKKRFHLFRSLFLQKREGAKYAAGGRSSCSLFTQRVVASTVCGLVQEADEWSQFTKFLK